MAETRNAPVEMSNPPHQGILRQENLVLRTIFGYANEKHTSPSASTGSLPSFLGECFPGSSMKDLLLVAIDVDAPQSYNKANIEQHLLHIGISILDSRHVRDLVHVGTHDAPVAFDRFITNYQFVIGNSHPARAYTASKKFLWGESEPICRSELQTRFDGLISGRDFVAVLHGTCLDLRILNDLNVTSLSRAVYIFDTNKVAQWPLQLHYRLSLRTLCETLGIPFTSGHAAGNDAHFALRALLMLAVRDAQRLTRVYGYASISAEVVLQRLQDIALAPRPVSEEDISATARIESHRQRKVANLEKKWLKRAMKQARKKQRQAIAGASDDFSDKEALDEEAIRAELERRHF
ncbi:hypothetical protein ACRALDRAFT_1066551 [Sodiomyces alcalophilus JCM 7366]|uniref:uncharacterized protein n=1 Tax=Sodiomyces alcalophilus JCM 7366 TaxID=591952 RepID=UPI0039B4E575